MISKKAKYGLIKNREGTTRVCLYKHRPAFYPSHDELLEDVEVQIDNNIMVMKANMISFYCNAWGDTMSYEELKEDGRFNLDPEVIEIPKFHAKFPNLFPKKYRSNWIEEKERIPFTLTANAFEIIE